jgi:hypothetical protein
MANMWRCDGVIDYSILEMMSMWWDYWRHDVVNNPITLPPITHVMSPITPHHIASYFPGAAANYHITSTSGRNVMR